MQWRLRPEQPARPPAAVPARSLRVCFARSEWELGLACVEHGSLTARRVSRENEGHSFHVSMWLRLSLGGLEPCAPAWSATASFWS